VLDLRTRLTWLQGSASLPGDWDRLAAAGPLMLSRSWLLADTAGQSALVAAASDGSDRLHGGLLAYLVEPESPPSPWLNVDGVLAERVRRLAVLGYPETPNGLLERLLPCLQAGPLSVTDSTVLVDPNLALDEAAALRDALVAAAERRAAAEGWASVAFLYVAEDDPLRGILRARGFLELATDGNAVMDVTWSDRDGYLASRSRRRQRNVRLDLQALAEARVELGIRAPTDELLAALVPLAHASHMRYAGKRTAQELAGRMQRLAARVATHVVTVEQAGRIVGFTFLHPWGDRLHTGEHFGIHEAVRGRLPVYFATTFYEPASFAGEHGFRYIFYGPAALQAKIARGCRVIRQYGYVRCLDGDLQARIAAALAHLLEP
jgi:predicted N-acyltransferase